MQKVYLVGLFCMYNWLDARYIKCQTLRHKFLFLSRAKAASLTANPEV